MRKVGFVWVAALAFTLVSGAFALAGTATAGAAAAPNAPAGKAPSAVTTSSAPDPSFLGYLVQLRATVTPTDGGGTFTFSLGPTQIPGCVSLKLGSGTGAAANQSTCSTTLLPVGHDAITATYSGDSGYAPSSATAVHVVLRDHTATAAQPAVLKLPLDLKLFTLTATVRNTSFAGVPVPGVRVDMTTGSTFICSARTDLQGIASCNGLGSLLPIVLRFGYKATFHGDRLFDPSFARAGLIG